VLATDATGELTHWSAGAARLFGWTAEEALGRNVVELLVPKVSVAASRRNLARLLAGETLEGELTLRRKDGTQVVVWAHRAPVVRDGSVEGIVAVAVQLGGREGHAPRESEAIQGSILRAALDAIVVIDEHGVILEFNPAAERMFGYTRKRALGSELAELVIPPSLRPAHREGLARAVATSQGTILDERLEAVAMREGGGEFPIELTITRMHGEPPRFAGFVRDISERVRAERQLVELGERDQLTGLPNLGALRKALAEALSAADTADDVVALLRVDLRRFSLVNDSLGRQRGDELLRLVADRLSSLDPPPLAVARDGGAGFWLAFHLEEPTRRALDWRERAVRVAGRLGSEVHGALAAPFGSGNAELSLRASIGISIYPLDALNRETMLEHADVATREARRTAGRPAVLFSGSSTDAREELELSTRLSRALAAREFELHYQPVVDLRRAVDGGNGQAIVGVEGLLRWRDPERGLVTPARFLPLLEETGMIASVGRFVVEEMFGQLAAWRQAGVDVWGAFNLSARELWQPDLVERIADEAESNGLPPEALTVEITESAAMEDFARALEVLDDLRDRGFVLAIDDFGTGHSSLGRLRELPVNVLKIDLSFTSLVPGDGATESIVAAIIQAAGGLGLQTLAEGIETTAQRDFMLERGCQLGQGYLFGRPQPASEVALP
jgi:PAS domain S-box-containing protein/diguanylate cyclase (GGDEF)-like protein